MKKLTQKKLKELMHYDPETGVFTWRVGRPGVSAGTKAGSLLHGYVKIQTLGKTYMAHRLVWLFTHGYFPEHEIDHINRDRSDNRICNLREVSRQCNLRNTKMHKTNKSGVTGVSFKKSEPSRPWRAKIGVNYKNISLGTHPTKIEAAKARWFAEVRYNFPSCNTTSSAYQYLKAKGVL